MRTARLRARINVIVGFIRAARAARESVHVISQRRKFPMRNHTVLFRTAIAILALLGSAACSTSTTPTTGVGAGRALTGSSGDTTSPMGMVAVGSGAFTFTPPAGIPLNGGCISINAITSPTLDWVIQPTPGHVNTVGMGSVFFHEPTPGCDTTDLDAVARPLFLTGPKDTYAPGETGTSTLTWPTDRCKDGGHFGISVWVLDEAPSEDASNRVSTMTVVDCGFPTPAGIP